MHGHLHLAVSCSINPPLHLFLADSAWQYGSPGFQELKAEVTEVPAPDSSEDNTGLPLIRLYFSLTEPYDWFSVIYLMYNKSNKP